MHYKRVISNFNEKCIITQALKQILRLAGCPLNKVVVGFVVV